MSFRIEEKLLINKKQILEFKDFLFKKHAKQLFPPRKILSLYFENFKDEMYKDSVEGTVPRKKIRVRNYLHDKNVFLYCYRLVIPYSPIYALHFYILLLNLYYLI